MSAKKYSFNKNDTPNCGDVVGVSMPTRNGRIIGLVPPKMNFGGVSNLIYHVLKLNLIATYHAKFEKGWKGVSVSALSFVGEFGQVILGVP
jgi:hypothetical protein